MDNNGGEPPRSDDELDLKDAVNLVRRNLLLITSIAVVIIGAVGWYTWTVPPVFEAHASVHVEPERGSGLGMEAQLDFISGLVGQNDVETEMALLRARSRAEAVVDSLGLQVKLSEPVGRARSDVFAIAEATRQTQENRYTLLLEDGRYRITDSEGLQIGLIGRGEPIVFNGMRIALLPESASPLDLNDEGESDFPTRIVLEVFTFRDAVRALTETLSVGRPFRDASMIRLTYTSEDPQLVADVPNLIAGVYVDWRADTKKTEANSTVDFLNEQILAYRDQLLAAEENLLNFQQTEQVVNLEAEGSEQVRRMVEAQADVDDIEADLTELNGLLAQIDGSETVIGEDPLTNPYRQLAAFRTFLEIQSVSDLLSQLNETEAEYVSMRNFRQREHPDMTALEQQILQLQAQLYQLAVNYRNTLSGRLDNAQASLARFGEQLEAIPDKAVQEARLEREKTGLEEVYLLLQSRLKEAEIAQAVEPGDVQVIDPAIRPTRPIRPRKLLNLLLGVIFGVVAGVGVAAARDYLDETVHSREELTRLTNLPVLGMIPKIRGAGSNGVGLLGRAKAAGDRLVTKNDSGNPVSEAYRAFRTNITFLDLDKPARSLVITSPGPSEGKSTSASNLAITLAQQGSSTILVDCDLRKGIVNQIFEAKSEPGVTDVLMGSATLEEAIQEVDLGEGTLHFIATGTIPPNPSEMIGSRQMKQFLDLLHERFEKVILDSPPLNLVTDAAVLGTMSDAVILVTRAGHTARGAIRYARDQLSAVRAPLSGLVLNDLDYQGRDRYYGAGAGYGYYHKYYGTDKKRGRKRS